MLPANDIPEIQSLKLRDLESAMAEIDAHSRRMGISLLWFNPQGQLVHGNCADPAVAPLLGDSRSLEIIQKAISQLSPQSLPTEMNLFPGVSFAAVPHLDKRQCIGVLAAVGDSKQLDASITRTVDLLFHMLRDKLRARRLEDEIQTLSTQLANAYEELSLIELISSGMRLNRKPDEFYRIACAELMQVMGVRGMGIAVRAEKARQEPILFGELDLPQASVRKLGDQLIAFLAEKPAVILCNDVSQSDSFQWLHPLVSQFIAVPLQRGKDVLGCFFAVNKVRGEFDSVDTKLLFSIANESAIYIENATLFGDLHSLMMGLMHSLTSAVDAKDAYTCGHSERVALLSRHIAAQIGMSDLEIEKTYMAGLLHDVGKIGVPESVLQKAGKLTAEEFDVMKKHPGIGAKILGDVPQLEEVIPGVLCHHERYDGKGYPKGLAGKDIPQIGRIICLADCFDAMTSNRTYRKALPIEVALAEIRRCAGTQFDPSITELFLQFTPDQFRLLLHDHQKQTRRIMEFQEVLRAA